MACNKLSAKVLFPRAYFNYYKTLVKEGMSKVEAQAATRQKMEKDASNIQKGIVSDDNIIIRSKSPKYLKRTFLQNVLLRSQAYINNVKFNKQLQDIPLLEPTLDEEKTAKLLRLTDAEFDKLVNDDKALRVVKSIYDEFNKGFRANNEINPAYNINTGNDYIYNPAHFLSEIFSELDSTNKFINKKESNYKIPERIEVLMLKEALEWAVTSNLNMDIDQETIDKQFLRLKPGQSVHPVVYGLFANVGRLKNASEKDLGRRIYNQLGIRPSAELINVNPYIEEILSNSLGQYAMSMLLSGGLLDLVQMPTEVNMLNASVEQAINKNLDTLTFEANPPANTFPKQFVRFNEEAETRQFIKDFKNIIKTNEYQTMSTDLFGTKSRTKINTSPVVVTEKSSDMRLNGLGQKGVPEAIAAINKLNSVEYKPNTNFHNLLNKISSDGLKRILGYKDNVDGVFGPHRQTVEGQNLSIESAVNSLEEFMEAYNEQAKGKGIYFEFRLWLMGRIGQVPSKLNLQAHKLHRHAFTASSWKTTVDINNEKQFDLFRMGIGSLLTDDINGDTKSGFIAEFEKFYKENKKNLERLITAQDSGIVEQILSSMEIDSEAKLDAVAQLMTYVQAINNNQTTFETTVITEIDATTSGTAIGALIANAFFDMFNRFGLFKEKTRLLEYKKSNPDTYQAVARRLGDLARVYLDDYRVGIINQIVPGLLDIGDKVPKELRNLAKTMVNPIQYGSGHTALARNFAGFILENVYQQIESIHNDANENKTERYARLGKLLDDLLRASGSKQTRSFEREFSSPNFFTDFVMHPAELYAFQEIFNRKDQSFAKAIFDNVNDILGDISNVRNNVIDMNNSINHILKYTFDSIVERGITDENGVTREYTNTERKKLLKELQRIRPIMPSVYTDSANLDNYIDNTDYESIAPSQLRDFKNNPKDIQNLAVSTFDPKNRKLNIPVLSSTGELTFNSNNFYQGKFYNPIEFINVADIGRRPGSFFIQSIDASAMYRMANESPKSFYPIHDAEILSVFDLQEMANTANNAYVDLLINEDPNRDPIGKLINNFEEYLDNVDKVLASRDVSLPNNMSVRDLLTKYPNNEIRKVLGIDYGGVEQEINETAIEEEKDVDSDITDLEANTFIESLEIIRDVHERHQELKESLKTETLTVDIFTQPLEPLTIKPETDYQRIGESEYPSMESNIELANQIAEVLRKLYPTVSVKLSERVYDDENIEVLGKAVEAAVEVSRQGNLDTLPHEYAHIYVNVLETHPIINKTLAMLQTADNLTIEQAKEKLVKILGEKFVDLQANKNLRKQLPLAKRIWNAIIKFFSDPLSHKAMRDAKAREAINKQIDLVFDNFSSGNMNDAISFNPKPGYEKVVFDEALKEEDFGREVLQNLMTNIEGLILTGSLALAPFMDIYRKKGNLLHDLDFIIDARKTKRKEFEILRNLYPGSEHVYGQLDEDGGYGRFGIITYLVPPKGHTISNIQRHNQLGRVISYDILDSNGNIVNTYKATVEAVPGSNKTKIIDETYTNSQGIKAKYIDFIDGKRSSLNYYSKLLDTKIALSHYKDVFHGKYKIGMRSKDILDYNLMGNPTMQKGIAKSLREAETLKLGSQQDTGVFDNANPVSTSKLNINSIRSIFNRLMNSNPTISKEHQDTLDQVITLITSTIGDREFNLEEYILNEKNLGDITNNTIRLNNSMNPAFTALDLSPQEILTHETVHGITRFGIEKKTFLRNRLIELREQAKKVLTPEDFLARNPDGSIKIVLDEQAEREAAQKRYDYIFNTPGVGLHEFVAFGLTNEQVKKALSGITYQYVAPQRDSLYEKVVGWFQDVLNLIYDQYTGRSKMTMDKHLFNLAYSLAKTNQRAENTLFGKLTVPFSYANAQIGKVLKNIDTWSKKPNPNRLQRYVRVVGNVGTLVKSDQFRYALAYIQNRAVESNIKSLNVFAGALLSLPTEIKGMSDDLGNFNLLTIKSKKEVEGNSQQVRETVAGYLASEFSRELDDNELTALHYALTKTDIGVLNYGLPSIAKMLREPAVLQQEINKHKSRLEEKTKFKPRYVKYAKALGYFMVHKVATVNNLMLNADNIVDQVFTGKPVKIKNRDAVKKDIDTLKTLYAMQFLQRSNSEITKLAAKVIEEEYAVNNQTNGIVATINSLKDFKAKSKRDLFNNNPVMMQAGIDAEILDPNAGMVISDDPDNQELIKRGYRYEGPLSKDPLDIGTQKYIYVNPYGGELPWVKGAFSLTNPSAAGSLLKKSEYSIGAIEQNALADMDNEFINFDETHIIPVVAEDQSISDYRYEMTEANRRKYFKKDTNLINNIAYLEGKYTNKIASKEINKLAIDTLFQDYQDNYLRNPGEYVTINNDPDNPYKEIWRMMPYYAREYAYNKFKGNMYVRADLLQTIFGYRELSITQSNKRLDTNFFRVTERIYKDIIGHFRTRWVLLTDVAFGNVASNTMAGLSHNVPIDYWLKKSANGVYLIEDYLSKQKKMLLLNMKAERSNLSPAAKANLELRVKELQSDLEANPMHKLMDMGLLSSIVDDIVIQQSMDKFSYRNKMETYFNDKVGKKIPKTLKNLWSSLYMSDTSPLFKTMYKFTQYSDMTAKYALYTYLTEEKGQTPEQAIKAALDTFIQYDTVTSPLLKYTNDMGFTPFTKYRLRILKQIGRLLFTKPANSATVIGIDEMFGVSNIMQGATLTPIDIANPLVYPENAPIIPVINLAEGIFN